MRDWEGGRAAGSICAPTRLKNIDTSRGGGRLTRRRRHHLRRRRSSGTRRCPRRRTATSGHGGAAATGTRQGDRSIRGTTGEKEKANQAGDEVLTASWGCEEEAEEGRRWARRTRCRSIAFSMAGAGVVGIEGRKAGEGEGGSRKRSGWAVFLIASSLLWRGRGTARRRQRHGRARGAMRAIQATALASAWHGLGSHHA